MTQRNGMLIVALGFESVAPDEFDDWYDTEHIPERKRVPGFLSWERWNAVDNPRLHMATYDLSGIEVLRSAPYLAVSYDNFSPWSKRVIGRCQLALRFEGEQINPGNDVAPAGAGAMLLMAFNVAPDAEQEYGTWMDQEHLPRLARVPGVLSARRFRAVSSTHQCVALYHLVAPEACATPAWLEARETPWTHRIRTLTSDRLRVVFRAHRRE